MPTILGIESTCDETGASVVVDGTDVRSSVIASQVSLHEKYRGVVPEIASRAHIENILPVIRESLAQAACGLANIDAIAIAHRPGLIGSLLVGVTAAKTLAWSLGKPLIAVDHVHAHLYSVMLQLRPGDCHPERYSAKDLASKSSPDSSPSTAQNDEAPPVFPAVGLVISGGHTALYEMKSWSDVALIGSTIDDAVGEAYDKVAAILGLSYPGGPIIDALARQGDPHAIEFPRSMLGRDSLDFSFSGLKTSVLYRVRGVPGRNDQPADLNEINLRNIAASFQAACVDTLVKKLKRAAKQTHAKSIVIGGGVSANSGLRDALREFEIPVYFPQLIYCTDNAAMTAGLAHLAYERGDFAPLDLDAITYSQFRDR